MNKEEIFYTMALTRLTNFNYQQALELYRMVGSAQLLYEYRSHIGDVIGESSPRLVEALKNWDDAMKRAETELMYMEEHSIRALTLTDDDYPQRLTECQDAPIILYYKGNADLNLAKIVSIGLGHKFRQQSPMSEHLVSRLTMAIRIDLIQSMRQHTYRIITVGQSLTVGMDIDTVGQAADDEHLWTSLPQICDETVN